MVKLIGSTADMKQSCQRRLKYEQISNKYSVNASNTRLSFFILLVAELLQFSHWGLRKTQIQLTSVSHLVIPCQQLHMTDVSHTKCCSNYYARGARNCPIVNKHEQEGVLIQVAITCFIEYPSMVAPGSGAGQTERLLAPSLHHKNRRQQTRCIAEGHRHAIVMCDTPCHSRRPSPQSSFCGASGSSPGDVQQTGIPLFMHLQLCYLTVS